MKWPTESGVPAFFGEAGSPLATAGTVNLPFAMKVAWAPSQFVKSFRCHKLCEAPFERIWQNTLAHYGEATLRALGLDLFGGCYNFRPKRGTKNQWSMHAYGIAIDVDPAHNQLRWNRAKASLAKADYAPFWKIVEAEGGYSLGRARDYDWMHFQFATR